VVKIYGKGDTVSSSEFWDGRTKNNLLQDFLKKDYTNFLEFIQPIKELMSQQFESFDFIERVAQTKLLHYGVLENSFLSEFKITEDDVVKIIIFDKERIFARLPPGIAVFNKNIYMHKPAVVLASKELDTVLEMNRKEQDSIEIKYSYITDSFKCKISKKFDPTEPAIVYTYPEKGWEDDSIVGYTHSAKLLEELYNGKLWKDFFVNKVGSDITKINIEKLVELESNGIYYWVMNNNGDIELTQTLGTNFLICSFENNNGIISNINNNHHLYQNWGDAQIDENGVVFYESPNGLKFIDDSGSNITMYSDGRVIISNSDGNGNVLSSIIMNNGNVEIDGDFSVSGVSSSTGTATLQVESNVIEVNNGMIDDPPAGLKSGLLIHRGLANPEYNFVFDETDLSLKGGLGTDLKVISQRELTPVDKGVPFWDDVAKIFKTSSSIIWNGTQLMANVDQVDGLHANDLEITADTTLATKNKVKTYVDDIKTAIETSLNSHKNSTTNPHSVTQAQVGLSNTPNWAGSTNVNLGNSNSTIPSQLAVKSYVDALDGRIPWAHFTSSNNPHSVTKAQVGLSNTPNWKPLTTLNRDPTNWQGAGSQVYDDEFVSAALIKGYVDFRFLGVVFTHFGDLTNPHAVTQAQVGLSNVPNWTPITAFVVGVEPTDSQFISAKLAKDYVDNRILNHDSEHSDLFNTKLEITNFLALKADKSDTNTKTEITNFLALKADKSDTNTKTEITNFLALKADKSDTNTKTEITNFLALKADSSHTHQVTDLSDSTLLGRNVIKAINIASRSFIRTETDGSITLRTVSEVRSDIGAEPSFTKNSAFNKNFGIVSGTVCQGNDSRLTNARTPLEHGNESHSEIFIEDTDSRLSDDRIPLSHGNEKHSSTFIAEGDSRLTNARAPTAHTHSVGDILVGDKSYTTLTVWSGSSYSLPAGAYYISVSGSVDLVLEIWNDADASPAWQNMGLLKNNEVNFMIFNNGGYRVTNLGANHVTLKLMHVYQS